MAGLKKARRGKIERQDVWLNGVIDDYLCDTMNPPRSGVFYPSTLSNTCNRYAWLAFNGKIPETPLPPLLNRIFQNGNFLENRVEVWFKDMGIMLDRELPVKFEAPSISGRIDFIISHQQYGKLPIELKSINDSGFSALTGPKDAHKLQLQIYLNIGDFDIGTVLYENKNNQKIKSFLVERDKNEWEEILTRCFTIQEMKEAPLKCTGDSWCNCKIV